MRKEDLIKELRGGIHPDEASRRTMEVYDEATKKDTMVSGGRILGEDNNWHDIDPRWSASYRLQWLITRVTR